MAQFQFNAQTVEPAKSFAPIPAGVYPAQIVESDMRPLKSGNGEALSLQFEILGEHFTGRRIFSNLNVHHNNPEAQRIAQEQLSAICHAVGVMQLADSTQLHMKPMKIRVKIRKQDGYEDRNEVSGYEPLGAQVVSQNRAATTPNQYQQVSQTAAASRKPWERQSVTEEVPF